MKRKASRLWMGFFAAAVTVLFVCVAPVAAAPSPAQPQGTLDDVLIKEKDSMRIESEKEPFILDIDVLKEILPIDTTLLERHDALPRISTITVFRPLESHVTVSPWLYAIARNPVMTFNVAGENSKTARWELVIVDMQGQPVKHFSGRGAIPEDIEWDGRDENDKFMHVGEIYSYFVITIDKSGEKNTSITRPFSIDAAVHREKGDIHISFVLADLFEKDLQTLTVEGRRLLTEASDILKGYHRAPFAIKVYDEADVRARAEAAVVTSFLSDHVMIAPEKISGEGYQSTPNDQYVDIVIKKP
jgi:hypothetical protein